VSVPVVGVVVGVALLGPAGTSGTIRVVLGAFGSVRLARQSWLASRASGLSRPLSEVVGATLLS